MPSRPSMGHARRPAVVERSVESPRLDHKLQAEIGRHLQALYQATLDQPVPDRFVKLLAELERKQGGQG